MARSIAAAAMRAGQPVVARARRRGRSDEENQRRGMGGKKRGEAGDGAVRKVESGGGDGPVER